MSARLFVITLCVSLVPVASSAQDRSHWGVVGSVTPNWKVPTRLENLFGGTLDIKGSDLTIGVARGRDLGGDWGSATCGSASRTARS